MSDATGQSVEQATSTEQSNVEADPLEQMKLTVASLLKSDWDAYYQSIMTLPRSYQIAASLKLLNAADSLINQPSAEGELAKTCLDNSQSFQRSMLAGISDQQTRKHYSFSTNLLGNMESFASFKIIVKTDPSGVQRLLKIIPANGKIDGWHFMQFIDAYQSLFASHGYKQIHLFPATRLLSLRRPDQFFAISPQTVESICSCLNIKPLKKQDFQRYWDEVIGAIHNTLWFKSEAYQVSEIGVFRARVALFERIFYVDDGLSGDEESNYPEVSDVRHSESNNYGTLETATAEESNPVESTEAGSIGTDSIQIIDTDRGDIESRVAKQIANAKQPKKLTIAKRKSAKVNRNAATKLMSQYYFANKTRFPADKLKEKRETIIDKLVDGESVEEAFESAMAE